MRYGLFVQTGSEHRPVVHSALHFAHALISAGHSIERLFFYGPGATIANENSIFLQDECHLLAEWQAFIVQHRLDAVVCIAAALQRGVLDEQEARRYRKSCGVLMQGFTLGGLGQAAEMFSVCDRVVSF